MLDRLIDLLLQWVTFFVPFAIIDAYEEAVVLRFGRHNRDIGPGFHWVIPFEVERVIADNVVPRTNNLSSQTLCTKDGRTVVVGAVVTSRICDIRKATLEVESVDQALKDACYGAVGELVTATTYEELTSEAFSTALTKACRKTGWRYGIEIERVRLSDLAPTKSISLFQG